jgi:hypothetical protein
MLELVSVVAIEAELSPEPQEAVAILVDADDERHQQALFHIQVFEAYGVLCLGNRRRELGLADLSKKWSV